MESKRKERKRIMVHRWASFVASGCWDFNYHRTPTILSFLKYFRWLIKRYHYKLAFKIFGDLVRHYILLYGKNPMRSSILRNRLKNWKIAFKSGRRNCIMLPQG